MGFVPAKTIVMEDGTQLIDCGRSGLFIVPPYSLDPEERAQVIWKIRKQRQAIGLQRNSILLRGLAIIGLVVGLALHWVSGI